MSPTKKEEKKLNLYQKIVEVRKAAVFIKKDTRGYNWDFANECAILSVVRPVLDKHNIWVDQEMESLELVDVSVAGKISSALMAKLKYTIVDGDNPQDFITKTQFMVEPGVDCKKVGHILTYGNRYFWFKFLQIPQGSKEDLEKISNISMEDLVKVEVEVDTAEELGKKFMDHFDDNERPALQNFIKWFSKEVKKNMKETLEMCLTDMKLTRHQYSEWKGPKTVAMTG